MIKHLRLALKSWRPTWNPRALKPYRALWTHSRDLEAYLGAMENSHRSHRTHSPPSRHQCIQKRWGLTPEYWWFTLHLRRLSEEPWWVNLKPLWLNLESYISSGSHGGTKQWRLTLHCYKTEGEIPVHTHDDARRQRSTTGKYFPYESGINTCLAPAVFNNSGIFPRYTAWKKAKCKHRMGSILRS